jgi:hypothetical protein
VSAGFLGLITRFEEDELMWNVGQRQFQAERSTNKVVDRLISGSGKG